MMNAWTRTKTLIALRRRVAHLERRLAAVERRLDLAEPFDGEITDTPASTEMQ